MKHLVSPLNDLVDAVEVSGSSSRIQLLCATG